MHESYPERQMEDLTSSDELSAARPEQPTGTGQSGQVTEQVQQQAGKAVNKAQQQAVQRASGQKDRLAQGLQSTARALTQVSQQLSENQQDTVAHYADLAADRVRQASDYLSRQDVGQLVDDVEDVARRQPALVLGGAFALGLLAARLLKSSRSSPGRAPRTDMPRRDNYGNVMVQESPSYRPYPRSGYGASGTGVE